MSEGITTSDSAVNTSNSVSGSGIDSVRFGDCNPHTQTMIHEYGCGTRRYRTTITITTNTEII